MRNYQKRIIFTKIPLCGYFRYKDIFQIYPADLINMPKSVMQRHHPVILEYWIDEKDEIEVKTEYEGLNDLYSFTATTTTKEDRILNLLSIITNNLFFRYYDLTGTWGMPVLEDFPGEKANEWSSKWNMILFHWPELTAQLKINEFTRIEIPEVKFIRHFNYYWIEPNFDYYYNREIEFPNTIYDVLNSYFSKSDEILSVIDSAIAFSVSAMELYPYKKTLSLLSSFTSIETMVNFEFKDDVSEKCENCGQLQYKVAKKYREFLFKYIGKGEGNKKKFNHFYSIRSKIIHTGQRLKSEKLFTNISKEEEDKEFFDIIEILQLGKLAIVHWLYKNK